MCLKKENLYKVGDLSSFIVGWNIKLSKYKVKLDCLIIIVIGWKLKMLVVDEFVKSEE